MAYLVALVGAIRGLERPVEELHHEVVDCGRRNLRRGAAEVDVQRAKVLGMDVAEWRAPIRWSLHPTGGGGELEIRESNAQVAQGRVTAQARAAWNSGELRRRDVACVKLENAAAAIVKKM